MARGLQLTEKSISAIVSELEKANDKAELIHDAVIDFNPVLKSPIVYDVIDNLQAYLALTATNLTDMVEWMSDTYDELVKGSIKQALDTITDELTGNKMQEEENRREMIEALSNIGSGGGGSGNIPPPLPRSNNDDTEESGGLIKKGIFGMFAKKLLSWMPASFQGLFATMASFFGSFLKFGKVLIKFAGPIGIAISVIMGLIGAIKGGIEGFKEGGVEGAIKGALVGLVDGLIGGLVKGIANALGWLLKAIGLKEIGAALGPAIKGIFDNIYSIIGGFIDLVVGLFTLDSDKVIGAVKQIITAGLGQLKILGSLFVTMIKELVPLILKGIKFVLWDLPKFITGMLTKLWDYLWSDEGKKAISDGIGKIGAFISELGDKIVTDLWPWLKKKISGAFESLGDMFTGVLLKIVNSDLFSKYGVKIVSTIQSIFTTITDWANGVANSIGEWIPGYKRRPLSTDKPQKWVDATKDVKIPKPISSDAEIQMLKDLGIYDDGSVMPVMDFKPINRGPGLSYAQQTDARFKTDPKNSDAVNEVLSYLDKNLKAAPGGSGSTLMDTYKAGMNAPVIINNMGGNVTNTNTSNVSNNTTSMEPILSGSGLGFTTM